MMVPVTADDRSPLTTADLAAAIGSAWTVEAVAETSSTNADLLGRDGDRILRVAHVQHGGRGRLDRSWQSPPGAGLTFSMLVRPAVDVARWGWLPLLAGLAVREAVGPEAMLKWPNDVLLGPDERKVAGILVQVSGAPGGAGAVIGVGLNVTTRPGELPVPTATSLALQGLDTDRVRLLAVTARAVDELLATWEAAGGDVVGSGLAARYRRACTTIGRRVTVVTGERGREAEALDLDPEGRLLVRYAGESATTPIAAADITHIRPAAS